MALTSDQSAEILASGAPRIGQRRGVQVFKLVSLGTLEEKISAIIEKKRQLMADIVREDDPGLLKSFSREDLLQFLS